MRRGGPARGPAARRQRGVNLVELIIAIVIISIAATGVLLVYTQVVRYSADPMIQQQAVAIAEAYLDEILARPVADPDGSDAGESRATFDDVDDYAGLSQAPRTQDDVALTDLADYTVTVAVTPGQVVSGVAMARVDVTVTYGALVNFTLTGYRAD